MMKVLTFVLMSFISVGAWATPSGLDWLSRMTDSFESLAYDGVFVHQEAGMMNSMRIRHGLIGGVDYESLEDLDGQRIAVIRADDSIICVFPDKEDYANGYLPGEPFKRFAKLDKERLSRAYDIRITDHSQRIASREAVKVKLMPKDEFRHGHKFWIDKDNGFLLKHDVLDHEGKLLERIQFTSVTFDPDLKEEDFTPSEEAYTRRFIEVEPQIVKRQWQFDWLPTGFELVWQDARQMNPHTNMMLLSDGMSTVSVFVEQTQQKRPQTFMNMGATVAGEQSINVDDKTYLLTMVGEVPAVTIQRLMAVIMPKQIDD